MNKFQNVKRAEKKEFYPLSPAQKRLFFNQQLNPKSLTYNLIEIIPDYSENPEIIEKAVNKIINQYPIFRTTFPIIDGEPVQYINEKGNIKIELLQYENLSIEEISKSIVKPFNLGNFPLIRIYLIHSNILLSPLLIVEFHHIIFDATTILLFYKTLGNILSGKQISVPEYQYIDYSEWLNKTNKPYVRKNQKDFWKTEFLNPVSHLELPTDFQRPHIKSYEGDTFTFIIDKDTTSTVKAMAEGFGISLFTILLCAFKIFLKKISGQEDVVVGVPVSGRNHPEFNSMFGMFVNMIPIRSFLPDELSVVGYLKNLKEKVKNCLDNQDIPFDEIVKNANISRDSSASPLFNIAFDMLNHDKNKIDIGDFKNTNIKAKKVVASEYDFLLKAVEVNNNILFVIEYSTELFLKTTIERLIEYFQIIIKSIIKNPLQTISEIDFITEKEKKELLYKYNKTKSDYPKERTIKELFEKAVTLFEHRDAIVYKGKTVTYEELNKKSNQLARSIKSKGITKYSLIGIMLSRSSEMFISILGVLKAGCTYTPIDPAYPADRIKYIAADSKLRLLLTEPSLKDTYNQLDKDIEILDITSKEIYKNDKENLPNDFSSSTLAYLIYTSGSTGKPKGIMIEHKNVINFIGGVTKIIPFPDGSIILCLTTISFDIFVLESILPLIKGLKIILANSTDQQDTGALSRLIIDQKVTFIQITPSHLKILLSNSDSEDVLKGIKVLMVGGEAFPSELLHELRKNKYRGKIYNMYGPTETTVWSTIKELTNTDSINIGTPISNTIIRILGNNKKLQPIGVVGELCIGGEGVARGYWNNEQLTREKFIEDPITGDGKLFRTGDMARWLSDGEIECLGRIDNQVKIRGFRIELGEIESHMLSLKTIKETVVCVKEKEGDKYLLAYYVSEKKISPGDIKAHLSQKVPDYMVPAHYMHLKALPLTPNGKLDRKALPEPEIKAEKEYLPPSNEIEAKLVEIWADVLKTDKKLISINRSFFDLGGHSLKANALLNKIEKEFNAKVLLQEIFKYQDIISLGKLIQRGGKTQFFNIEKTAIKNHYKLSSAQKRLYFLYEFEKASLAYKIGRAHV